VICFNARAVLMLIVISLGLYAEIWSCCWSPKGDRIATCSEDQTTVRIDNYVHNIW
jgi:WD40 repeat protein